MPDKKAKYEVLCKEVRKCTICENVMFSPYIKNSDSLKNESNSEKIYINKWNADFVLPDEDGKTDVMIIGQDYGAFESNKSPTDDNLDNLILKFIFDNKPYNENRVFKTNLANCYRQKKSTGKFNTGCLALCANKFMGRLIKIISPKIIIVLGQTTFEALAFCDGADLICTDPVEKTIDDTFSEIIKRKYKLQFRDGESIHVFPVYHPGSNGRRNRSEDKQEKDWKRIRKYLGEVKIL